MLENYKCYGENKAGKLKGVRIMGWDEGRNINLKDVLSKQVTFKKWLEENETILYDVSEKILSRQKECWEQGLWISSVFGWLKDHKDLSCGEDKYGSILLNNNMLHKAVFKMIHFYNAYKVVKLYLVYRNINVEKGIQKGVIIMNFLIMVISRVMVER